MTEDPKKGSVPERAMAASEADPEFTTIAARASGGPRATPADPMPGAAKTTAGVPSAKREKPPPTLGIDSIAVLEGLTFVYSDSLGDIPEGSIGGLLHQDTRHLNRWEFRLNGALPKLLRSHTVDYYSAAFFLTNPPLPGLPGNSISIRRTRFVGDGMSERFSVHSFVDVPVRLELRISAGSDFADLFEVKAVVRDRSEEIVVELESDHRGIVFRYEHDGFRASTHVHVSDDARIDGGDIVWNVELEPRGAWHTSVEVLVGVGGTRLQPVHEDFGEQRKKSDDTLARWLADVPRFHCSADLPRQVFEKSVHDIAALRIQPQLLTDEFEVVLPAAGLPWFMTLFGRDSLVTSYQSLWVGPELAKGALAVLAFTQGREVNDFKDEEPGKIMHEIRFGELTVLGEKPHSPYYGNTDATALWLVVANAYWRWTGDDTFVTRGQDKFTAALDWIDTYGDRDNDGYVEYATKSPQGLGNQCWRDSWNGVQFADGSIPYLPIAIAEAQGYTYDAKLRMAEMAELLHRPVEWADRLRREASELKERFNRDFWVDERGGYFAIGLDGDKRRIDSMTSNMGHLLWSGIVDGDKAELVVRRLMSDEMFSGWGVRTLSSEDAGFNPIEYHLGTIWPHDNSIIAAGMARYGFREEANRIILAQLEAASFSEFRLPEAFAGFHRDIGRFPVPYPTACSPQAWATGAPFLMIRTMLGLNASDGKVTIDPYVPEAFGELVVNGLRAFGTQWNVRASGTEGSVQHMG